MTKVLVTAQDDITHKLPALQFSAQLNDSELSQVHLRKRTHELILHAAAQSAYLVGMLNTITHYVVAGELVSKDTFPRNRINIGFIGGGRLTRHLVSALQQHGKCAVHDITVSTYQPNKLEDLQKLGVHVCCDNRLVIEQCDIVFVCIPAHQIVVLKRDIMNFKHPLHFFVPFVGTLSKSEVADQLQHKNILKTDYMFNSDASYMHSEPYQSIAVTLEEEDVIDRLFPLGPEPGYVYTSTEWVRDVILVFYRHVLKLTEDANKSLDILNFVLFHNDHSLYFVSKDFRMAGEPPRIPDREEQLADLVDLGDKVCMLNAKLASGDLAPVLFEKFKSFFGPKNGDVHKYNQ